MKKNLCFGLLILTAGPLLAADASPKDTVTSAAAALGSQNNYTWKSTVEVPEDAPFKPGPTDGKTEKDGYTTLTMSFNDNSSDAVLKGTNAVIKTDAGWQTIAEATADNGGGGGFNPGMFMARNVQNLKTPAVEAVKLADESGDLAAGTNGISGTLSEAGVKSMLTFRRRGGNNGDGPTITNPKGSVTFWIADGKLTKYAYHVSGTVSFNGNDRDIDRTTTTVISDVNSTTITVADEAKKKLE